MTLRAARLWHVPFLLRILWAHREAERLSDLWIMVKVTARGWVRLVSDGPAPVGFVMRDEKRLHALYVHPRAQGRGVGRALLQEAQSDVAAIDLWVHSSNTDAHRFYVRHGFVEKQRAGPEQSEILMVWPPERRHPK